MFKRENKEVLLEGLQWLKNDLEVDLNGFTIYEIINSKELQAKVIIKNYLMEQIEDLEFQLETPNVWTPESLKGEFTFNIDNAEPVEEKYTREYRILDNDVSVNVYGNEKEQQEVSNLVKEFTSHQELLEELYREEDEYIPFLYEQTYISLVNSFERIVEHFAVVELVDHFHGFLILQNGEVLGSDNIVSFLEMHVYTFEEYKELHTETEDNCDCDECSIEEEPEEPSLEDVGAALGVSLREQAISDIAAKSIETFNKMLSRMEELPIPQDVVSKALKEIREAAPVPNMQSGKALKYTPFNASTRSIEIADIFTVIIYPKTVFTDNGLNYMIDKVTDFKMHFENGLKLLDKLQDLTDDNMINSYISIDVNAVKVRVKDYFIDFQKFLQDSDIELYYNEEEIWEEGQLEDILDNVLNIN